MVLVVFKQSGVLREAEKGKKAMPYKASNKGGKYTDTIN